MALQRQAHADQHHDQQADCCRLTDKMPKLVGAVSIPHGLPHSTTLVVKEIYILSAVCGLWRAVRYGNRTYGLAYATTLVVEMFSTFGEGCGLLRFVRYGNRTYACSICVVCQAPSAEMLPLDSGTMTPNHLRQQKSRVGFSWSILP
jgi:hypothetical protein